MDKLESLIGNLNHAVQIIPPERYFLTLLHHLMKRLNKFFSQRLQSWHIQYLYLWIKILQWVTAKEVPINNIVFVTPMVTLWYNSCENYIWGYNDKFMAWRWRIPQEFHGVLTLNLLGFLDSKIYIYITIQQLVQGSHILSFTDSSSSLGWMHRASFDPVEE